MPSVSAPGIILVSGASGFVATHLINNLLAKGYTVRGTVRSKSKGDALRELYMSPKFEYVVVPDIGEPGAWDQPGVLDDVHGIAHVASPIEFFGDESDPDAQAWLRPAVEGTLAVLRSAAKSPTVKRIVITGTTASVVDPRLLPVVNTKDDWNDFSVEELEKKGSAADSWTKYCASKVLSEKGAWKFYEDNRATLPYDLTYLLPSWVYGPLLTPAESPERLVLSMRLLFNHFAKPKTDDETLKSFSGAFSDARDIARAYIDAFSRDDLAGKRIVLASEKHPAIQDLYDAYWAIPEAKRPRWPFEVPRGKPGIAEEAKTKFPTFVTSEPELGWRFRTLCECLEDTLQSFVDTHLI
ncbi:NAD(P)-binding protein [Exidia glandulosa HHB12029]|uniref:NAD(P)-binding protein n=1 Tax=Exidia glandulosa HHB12029 TaxID=1314781 RepID=A0A165FWT1_EXIGL|nr:NAD(P)-binding protein [Exidia glandulosa HHB12029]